MSEIKLFKNRKLGFFAGKNRMRACPFPIRLFHVNNALVRRNDVTFKLYVT